MSRFRCEDCGRTFCKGLMFIGEEGGKIRLCPWCMSSELSIRTAVCSKCGSGIYEGQRLYETADGDTLCEGCIKERRA